MLAPLPVPLSLVSFPFPSLPLSVRLPAYPPASCVAWAQTPCHTISQMQLNAPSAGSGFTTYCSPEFEAKYLTAQEIQHHVHHHRNDVIYVWAG